LNHTTALDSGPSERYRRHRTELVVRDSPRGIQRCEYDRAAEGDQRPRR